MSFIMSHSTALKPMLPKALIADDCFLPDAPEQIPDPAKEDDRIDDVSRSEGSTGKVTVNDVKLEDLFLDFGDDENDELSRSADSSTSNESTPPEAPL